MLCRPATLNHFPLSMARLHEPDRRHCMLLLAEVILILSNGVRLATLSCHFIPDDAHIVVEGCGAIPDLEDREGEVSGVTVHPCSLRVTNFVRPPYIKLLYTVDWKLSSFWSQRTQMSMHKTLTVGRLCITHAPRYVARFLLYPLPPTFRERVIWTSFGGCVNEAAQLSQSMVCPALIHAAKADGPLSVSLVGPLPS